MYSITISTGPGKYKGREGREGGEGRGRGESRDEEEGGRKGLIY